ncbi:gluconokinase [Pseudooceanicola sp. CBS1P-1]|uniref:Gluconokinase n=1 Tax=Pseudooceanicola albus TaxID=2692189 RepID=A0A6L7G9H1_9RHOB|nr:MULTISPECIES: gluconokinase [Pseudooceanicola]MBT9384322.1 gluconokinase [Pseudooceanicola endophyticus]MXN19940.1 gluconokinase [Pseudooceanicola albus]
MTAPRRIVVMGVTACGKTSLAQALAGRLGLPFLEADRLHPPENIAAMSRGVPLDDAMRAPWLDAVATKMRQLDQDRGGVVVACSALKRRYRDRLRADGPVFFLHLAIGIAEVRRRLALREGHFMNPVLADSQFAALEPLGPQEAGGTLDATMAPEALRAAALARLG